MKNENYNFDLILKEGNVVLPNQKIEKLDIGDGRARYEEAGEHHEHLIDVETGEIIEFQNEELEEMKRQVALNMGFELVDHRLELFGKKIKK